jgi:uncharacterized protein
MATFLATFLVFTLAVTGLAIGWLVAEKKLKGSCGGLGSAACGVCAKPCEERIRKMREQAGSV